MNVSVLKQVKYICANSMQQKNHNVHRAIPRPNNVTGFLKKAHNCGCDVTGLGITVSNGVGLQ